MRDKLQSSLCELYPAACQTLGQTRAVPIVGVADGSRCLAPRTQDQPRKNRLAQTISRAGSGVHPRRDAKELDMMPILGERGARRGKPTMITCFVPSADREPRLKPSSTPNQFLMNFHGCPRSDEEGTGSDCAPNVQQTANLQQRKGAAKPMTAGEGGAWLRHRGASACRGGRAGHCEAGVTLSGNSYIRK